MPDRTPPLLGASEAAAYLDVQPSTLYAYVSRGLLQSVPDPGDARRRRYRTSDLDRLRRRSQAHAGHGAAAASALDWGAPSLDTELSRIAPEGHAYRGRPVAELVEQGVPFEAVAELLWSGRMGEGRPRWLDDAAPPLELEVVFGGGAGPREAWPVDVLRVAVTLAGLEDPARFAPSEEAEIRVARHLVVRAARSLARQRTGDRGPLVDEDSVAALLAGAFGRAREGAALHAMDAALVVVADHELNASTFAARVAASTGADLYACVAAALATFTGARHGGACDQCAALVSEAEAGGSVRAVLTGRVRRGESLPGFGHRLYPEGDPRFTMLVDLARAASDSPLPAWFDELLEASAEMELGPPTSDLGLVVLARALGLPDAAAVTMFAVGRMAGWIAHALEQRRQGFLLRPRARYVGA